MRTRAVPGVHDASERALADLSPDLERIRVVVASARHLARPPRFFAATRRRASRTRVASNRLAGSADRR